MKIFDISANFLKKHRISIIAVLAFSVALTCIFAFAGNKSEPETDDVSESVNIVGEAVYIDGHLVSAFYTVDEANSFLDNALANRVAELGIDADFDNSFNNVIEVINGEYPEEAFIGNDSLSLIGEDVKDYNGELLPVELTVRSVQTLSRNVVIEHKTKTIFTDAIGDGVKNLITKGYDGEGVETYQVISLNGVETEEVVVSLEVTSAAIDEVAQVGTRSDGIHVASLNIFEKPFDGIITSYMGPRWGRQHTGIDIWYYECFRKPATAAADGVVVFAGERGGYGNCVIVDHGNGVETLYAHFDELKVSTGDEVSTGDVVGLIGSTGYSTGPHLHFEVIIDGEKVNPLIFVEYEYSVITGE